MYLLPSCSTCAWNSCALCEQLLGVNTLRRTTSTISRYLLVCRVSQTASAGNKRDSEPYNLVGWCNDRHLTTWKYRPPRPRAECTQYKCNQTKLRCGVLFGELARLFNFSVVLMPALLSLPKPAGFSPR